MVADIILDFNQLNTYSALEDEEDISYKYWMFSMFSLVANPLFLFIAFFFALVNNPLDCLPVFVESCLAVIFLPLTAISFYYIVFPISSVTVASISLWKAEELSKLGEGEVCGKRFRVEDETSGVKDDNSYCSTFCNIFYTSPIIFKRDCDGVDLVMKLNLVQLKMLESFGEAIPQLIIAAVFCANHWQWVKANDQLFGIPLPGISIATIIFSSGSIAFGMFSEGKLLCGRNNSEE